MLTIILMYEANCWNRVFSTIESGAGPSHLNLWMLGNILKIDSKYPLLLKTLKLCFGLIWNDRLSGKTGWISGQAPSYSAAGLDPTFLHKYKSVSWILRFNSGYLWRRVFVKLQTGLSKDQVLHMWDLIMAQACLSYE